MNVRSFVIVPQVSDVGFFLPSLFSLCRSNWVISIFLSSYSLIFFPLSLLLSAVELISGVFYVSHSVFPFWNLNLVLLYIFYYFFPEVLQSFVCFKWVCYLFIEVFLWRLLWNPSWIISTCWEGRSTPSSLSKWSPRSPSGLHGNLIPVKLGRQRHKVFHGVSLYSGYVLSFLLSRSTLDLWVEISGSCFVSLLLLLFVCSPWHFEIANFFSTKSKIWEVKRKPREHRTILFFSSQGHLANLPSLHLWFICNVWDF